VGVNRGSGSDAETIAHTPLKRQGCIKLLRFMRRSWDLIAYSQSNPEG